MKNRHWYLCIAISLLLGACGITDFAQKPAAKKEAEKPAVQLTLLPDHALEPGQSVSVLAKLMDLKTRTIITDEQLQSAQKFHLLVIDPTLTDYQHIHPQPTDTPGLYRFTFTPKLAGGYRAWADITVGGKQHYVMADMGSPRGGALSKLETREAKIGDYSFTLNFDTAPSVGKTSAGTIQVTNKKSASVAGELVHVASFSDDFRTVQYVPATGSSFSLEPQKAGFMKLFAQVKIGGKEFTVPFGVMVAP